MVCYYHPEKPAVGICKHCRRGLCNECAALADDSLACKDRHEEHVRGINLIEARGILQAKRMSSGYIRNAVFYGLAGAAFEVFGLLELNYLGLQAAFFLLLGSFLIYAAIANYLESRKFK
jgi:hypothetical protein